jgi:hypothetical protein
MMKYIIFISFLFCSYSIFGQNDTTIVLSPEILAKAPINTVEETKGFSKANLVYPSIARKYALQGKIVMSAIIEKDGKKTNIKKMSSKFNREDAVRMNRGLKGLIAKDLKPETDDEKKIFDECEKALEAEAIRVFSEMPDFIPAMDKGVAVRSRYYIPISFKLK